MAVGLSEVNPFHYLMSSCHFLFDQRFHVGQFQGADGRFHSCMMMERARGVVLYGTIRILMAAQNEDLLSKTASQSLQMPNQKPKALILPVL